MATKKRRPGRTNTGRPSLDRLTDEEKGVLHRCLVLTVAPGLYDDEEFHTLMGFSRAEMADLAARWPEAGRRDLDLAIHHAVVYLLGYPHDDPDIVRKRVGVRPGELERIFDSWRNGRR